MVHFWDKFLEGRMRMREMNDGFFYYNLLCVE